MASEIVSRSRISPTMITSGSSRSAPRNAAANERVCVCTSRCVMWQPFRLENVFDRIFQRDDVLAPLEFTCSTSAASVVDLPLPIEPVTRMRPF